MYIQCSDPCSGVARVAELGGQAGGKGLHHGGKRLREAQRADALSAGGVGAFSSLQKMAHFRWP